jgi:hypothetical protein
MLKKILLTLCLSIAILASVFSQSPVANCLISKGITLAPFDSLICKNDSVLFQLMPNGFTFSDSTSFDWRDASGKQLGTQVNLGIRTQVAFSVVCYIQEGNCKDTINASITVKDKIFVPIFASKTAICEGDSVILSTNYQPESPLAWTFPSGSGKACLDINCAKVKIFPKNSFTYTFSNQKTCHEGDSITVNIIPSPVFKGIQDIILCAGNTADSITLNSNPDSDVSYKWYESVQPNVILSTAAAPKIKPSVSKIYTVEMSRGNCFSKANVSVVVGNQYVIRNLVKDTIICPDTELLLDFYTTLDKGTYAYQWSPAGNGQPNAGTAIKVSPSNSTNYILSIKYIPRIKAAGYYCEWFDTVKVVVKTMDKIELAIVPSSNLSEFPIGKKLNISANPDNKNYEWYVNGQLIKDSIRNKILVTLKENSIIKAQYKDTTGCFSMATLSLNVRPNQKEIFPTIFNAEIENFKPFCKDSDVVTLERLFLFNRWGQIVYQLDRGRKNGIDIATFTGWDGKDKAGNDLGNDVYIGHYRVRYGDDSFNDGTIEVTLVR